MKAAAKKELAPRQRALLDELLKRQQQQRDWGSVRELAEAIGIGEANATYVSEMLVVLRKRGYIVEGQRTVRVQGAVALREPTGAHLRP